MPTWQESIGDAAIVPPHPLVEKGILTQEDAADLDKEILDEYAKHLPNKNMHKIFQHAKEFGLLQIVSHIPKEYIRNLLKNDDILDWATHSQVYPNDPTYGKETPEELKAQLKVQKEITKIHNSEPSLIKNNIRMKAFNILASKDSERAFIYTMKLLDRQKDDASRMQTLDSFKGYSRNKILALDTILYTDYDSIISKLDDLRQLDDKKLDYLMQCCDDILISKEQHLKELLIKDALDNTINAKQLSDTYGTIKRLQHILSTEVAKTGISSTLDDFIALVTSKTGPLSNNNLELLVNLNTALKDNPLKRDIMDWALIYTQDKSLNPEYLKKKFQEVQKIVLDPNAENAEKDITKALASEGVVIGEGYKPMPGYDGPSLMSSPQPKDKYITPPIILGRGGLQGGPTNNTTPQLLVDLDKALEGNILKHDIMDWASRYVQDRSLNSEYIKRKIQKVQKIVLDSDPKTDITDVLALEGVMIGKNYKPMPGDDKPSPMSSTTPEDKRGSKRVPRPGFRFRTNIPPNRTFDTTTNKIISQIGRGLHWAGVIANYAPSAATTPPAASHGGSREDAITEAARIGKQVDIHSASQAASSSTTTPPEATGKRRPRGTTTLM